MYIDTKTKQKVEIIKEINPATVRVKRLKDNVIYTLPKAELKKID